MNEDRNTYLEIELNNGSGYIVGTHNLKVPDLAIPETKKAEGPNAGNEANPKRTSYVCPTCNVVVSTPLRVEKKKPICSAGHRIYPQGGGFLSGLVGGVLLGGGVYVGTYFAAGAGELLWSFLSRLPLLVRFVAAFTAATYFFKGIYFALRKQPTRDIGIGFAGFGLGCFFGLIVAGWILLPSNANADPWELVPFNRFHVGQ
jgi:hypothetical protein